MQDLYTRITDKIIAELETGTVPWIRPWSGGDDPIPRNALSQRPYRGINTVLLGMEARPGPLDRGLEPLAEQRRRELLGVRAAGFRADRHRQRLEGLSDALVRL